MRRAIAATAATAAVAGGALTGALLFSPSLSGAQSTTDPSAPSEAPADPQAPPAGAPSPEERSQRLSEVLAPLVTDGTLTQAQADAVVARLAEAGPPAGEGRGGPGRGHHGPNLDVAAQALGMTTDELHEALRSGTSLAALAQEKGVDVQVVIDALVASVHSDIDQKVADGTLTQEEATEKKANATERVTAMVNGERPERPARGERPGRPGPGAEEATPPTTTG